MKKIYFLIFVLLLIIPNFNYSHFALASTTYYARIESDNIYFYSSPIDDQTYKLFEIPKTYFVELVGNAQDENDLFYSARYIDISGYVKKSEVQAVEGTPISPYANNISFRVFVPNGLDLKSSPSNTTPFNRIINVPYLTTDLIFYGKCEGEEMIPQKSNVWYYCKFLSGQAQYYGYLYSEFCDNLASIQPNTEVLNNFSGELFYVEPVNEETSTTTPQISESMKVFLIIAISLPCLFIVYLIFKPTHLIENSNQKNKHKIKKLRKSEYYELDN